MKIALNTERMAGNGPGAVDHSGFQSNYLYGLDDLCKKFVSDETAVLEIGCHRGVSTSLFCAYAKSVVGVDPKNTEMLQTLVTETANLTVYKETAELFIDRHADLKFDLIYIDARHDLQAVKKDIECSMRVLRPGGVLSGHDFRPGTGVARAVKTRFSGIAAGTTILHRFSDSSWAIDFSFTP